MDALGALLGTLLLLILALWLPVLLLIINGRLRDIHAEVVKLNERFEKPKRKRSERATSEASDLRVSRMAGAFPGLDSKP